MALSTELILTLQNLKGFGSKTILQINEVSRNKITTIPDLCVFWKFLKGKKFEKVTDDDLYIANRVANKIIEESNRNNVGVISICDDMFPKLLKECINEEGKIDPPIILYYRGNIKALEKPGIAIIGTREPTLNGEQAGIYFSEEFAKKGFNIVSGLAIGCDTAGHKGALNVNGTTTAFLANGLDWDSIYPKENIALAKEIVEKGGLLLSEYPVGQACNRYALVARDRLQAGLSYATIAIQTGLFGGTIHAVNATLRANKPLFMINYKHDCDLIHQNVQGNIKFVKEGKAKPLGRTSFDASLSIIRDSISKLNQLQLKG
jgi:DNA processing protein